MKVKIHFSLYIENIPMPIFEHEDKIESKKDFSKFVSYVRKYVNLELNQNNLIKKLADLKHSEE